MLTKKIADFSADLLDTVRGVLGEAKKCPADCECEKCEAEEDEVEEGYIPSADEPTEANKKTAEKVRALLAKEKKPVKEDAEQIDETAKIVAHLQKRYGDNIRKSHVRSAASDFGVDASKLAKAVRTKLGKNMLDEEEQIDEISKGTLGRYINKAKDSIDMASYRQGAHHGDLGSPRYNKLEKKLSKRHKGISTAVGKLTKEDAEQIDEISSKTLFSYGKKARKEAEKRDEPMHRARGRLLASKKTNPARGGYKLTKVAATFGEESEQIDELSKATMGRYINKAATKMGSQGVTAGLKIAADEKSSKNFKDMGKREKGIKLAVNKLTKEEQDFIDSLNDADIEQIDEISKGAALKYLSANKKDDTKARETGDYDRMTKRMRGTDMAVRKYTAKPGSKSVRVPATEEVEITEARGRPKKAGAKDFTIHPKTKEKLMHNNPEHMKKIEALQKNKVLEKPKIEAGQHIMNQLQKAKTSMLGGSTIHFTHGDSKHVSGTHAAKLLSKYAGMKPNEKEDFQKKIGHSHEQLMKHV
jgi:hypothetical protein